MVVPKCKSGGTYRISGNGLNFYKDQDGKEPLNATFSATDDTVIWVGTTGWNAVHGADTITLDWSPVANAPAGDSSWARKTDWGVYTTYQMLGPQDVPSNSEYTYGLLVPKYNNNAPRVSTAPSPSGRQPSVRSLAQFIWTVQWNAGDAIGVVQVTVGDGFVGRYDVNIVDIKTQEAKLVDGKAVPCTTKPPKGKMSNPPAVGTGDFTGLLTAPTDFTWANVVTVQGPCVDGRQQGITAIQVGYVQMQKFTAYLGTYSDGSKRQSPMQGHNIVDPKSDVNHGNNALPPWMENYGFGLCSFSPDDAKKSDPVMRQIRRFDKPRYVMLSHNGTATLKEATIESVCNTYIAAQIKNPGTVLDQENACFQCAVMTWHVNYSAEVNKGVLEERAGDVLTMDGTGFVASTGKIVGANGDKDYGAFNNFLRDTTNGNANSNNWR